MTELVELLIEEAILSGSGIDDTSTNGLDTFSYGGDAFGRSPINLTK